MASVLDRVREIAADKLSTNLEDIKEVGLKML